MTGGLDPRPHPVNGWRAKGVERPLPTLVKPVTGQTEAIEVVPKEPLRPGVYSFHIPGANIVFSVRFWEIKTDDFCVDEYVPFGLTEYRRCSDSPVEKRQGRESRLTSLVQEGRRHSQARNWKAAEKNYKEVLELDGENFEAHGQLGAIYVGLGDFEKSKFYSQRAINLRPDHPNPYYNMACAYARLGETEAAISLLRQAVAKGFKDFEWMKKDPDLESIHHDRRFKSLSGG